MIPPAMRADGCLSRTRPCGRLRHIRNPTEKAPTLDPAMTY